MRASRALAAVLALVPAVLVAPSAAAEEVDTPKAFPVVNGTYTPIAGNFDCDEGSDGFSTEEPAVVWYAPGSAADYLWTDLVITNGVLTKSQATLSINGTYVPIVGDFDSDGCDDIFWYGEGAAPDYLWWGGPTGFTPGVAVKVSGSYRPVAIGRWIVWYSPLGTESMWEGTGQRSAPFAARSFPNVSGTGYQPAVLSDSISGTTKLLWYTPGAGADSIWSIPNLSLPASYTVQPISISETFLVANRMTGLVMHGPGTAPDQLMNIVGGSVVFYPFTIEGSFRVAGKNRLVVWHGPGTARDEIWLVAPLA